MPIIGITGHSQLGAATTELVRQALHDVLRKYAGDDLTGLTCLARGADQIFAEVVLDLGGSLEVVIPAADYASGIPDPTSRARFESFVRQARAIHSLPFRTAGPDAYLAASKEVINNCDTLVAVWDGSPADGTGGTADAVQYATEAQRKIIVVWPQGAQRANQARGR